jgi:hypothetical protein
MPNQLSKQAEQRIHSALDQASTLIEDGMTPNDALVKAAEDNQIPIGHVRLMVNAINTGRTNAHRMSHEDPLEKAGEFQLADAATVMNTLFPDEAKTKQASFLEKVVAEEYSRGPRWLSTKKSMNKAARAVDWSMTQKKHVPETDPDQPFKVATASIHKLRIKLDEARLKVANDREAAMRLAENLRTYFLKFDHVPLAEARENGELLFGKQASVALGIVEREYGARNYTTPVDVNQEPYKSVREFVKLSAAFKQHRAEHAALLKEAEEAAKALLPFGPGPAQGRSVLEDQSSLNKEAWLGGMLSSGFGMMNAGDVSKEIAKRVPGNVPPSSSFEDKDLQSLMDPSHEMEIRNIQSEALLNDLMANDEVIQGYDPEEVVDAFNEVSQLTPYASNKKAIMRDLLRKRLGGGAAALDQFAVGDALRTQQSLQDIEVPNPTSLSVLDSIGATPGGRQSSKPGMA